MSLSLVTPPLAANRPLGPAPADGKRILSPSDHERVLAAFHSRLGLDHRAC